MKNTSSCARWLWKGQARLPGGSTSYEYPRSRAPTSGPMRAEFHSNLSPFAPCSSLSSSRLITFFNGRSSIYFSEHDILAADDRHRIGDHVPARHLVERGEVGEAGRAELQPVGLVGAVGDEIDAELALRRLDRSVDLAFGNMHALGDELEVVDELLHPELHLLARRRRDLVVVDHHRPGVLAQPVDALSYDAIGLAELLDAHEVAVVAVAVLAHRDVELHAIVD